MDLQSLKDYCRIFIKRNQFKWIIAMILLSFGLGVVSECFFSGLLVLLAGIYCMPPIMYRIDHLFEQKITFKNKVRSLVLLVGISLAFLIFYSRWKRPMEVIVVTKGEILKLLNAREVNDFIPINNPSDSSVFQVKNYILSNLNAGSSYQSLGWSKVFIMGEKCWVRHKYSITNKNNETKQFHRIFWMNSKGDVLSTQEVVK